MKHLFWILVFLNLLVFGGMIASKMLKQHMPAEARVQQVTPPPTIIIQSSDLVKAVTKSASEAAAASAASGAVAPAVAATGNKATAAQPKREENKNNNKNNNNDKQARREEPRRAPVVASGDQNTGTPRAKYKECSARVSMPEDDFHRIKGLLGRYPHAASRQVVDNGNGDSTARMNVVFMQVSDQEASAIQGIVGRYGQLNRSACNR